MHEIYYGDKPEVATALSDCIMRVSAAGHLLCMGSWSMILLQKRIQQRANSGRRSCTATMAIFT